MGNCLVTKLKGVVDNDNLDMFGYLQWVISSANLSGANELELTEAGVMKVAHGTIGGETEINVAANDRKYLVNYGTMVIDPNYDALMVYIPKYTIKLLGYSSSRPFDMSQLKYSESLESFSIGNCECTLDATVLGRLHTFAANRTRFQNNYDISELGANGLMTIITLTGCTGLTGSLDKAGMSPLTEFSAPNTKSVSLSIENFVAYNRAAGRTSGSLNITWAGSCNCTFNGASVGLQENNALSWDATTITFKGVTINA